MEGLTVEIQQSKWSKYWENVNWNITSGVILYSKYLMTYFISSSSFNVGKPSLVEQHLLYPALHCRVTVQLERNFTKGSKF